MKLLHTGDWHLGKRLHGLDRREEARAALEEITEVGRAHEVDAVLVAGDLLNRRHVDPVALGDCLAVLEGLARLGPVLVAVGNHDDPDLWNALRPYLVARGIHIAGRVQNAGEAVVSVETRAGLLHAALLPWPEPARLRTELGTSAQLSKATYADLCRAVLDDYARELRDRRQREGGAAVLVGHLMVDGAVAGGGEREMTMGITYAVSPHALPTDLDYVALGHVHRPQAIRSGGAARYAGSPLALDFSEDNHDKTACVVEISGQRTTFREVPLVAARPLARIRGPIDRLAELAAAHPRAWLLCEVELEHAVLDLVRQVRTEVPDALRIEPRYPAAVPGAGGADGGGDAPVRPLPELYEEWYREQDRALSPRLRKAFEQALADADANAADT
ncbi:MAG: exonuclease subunit SbcD [Thermoleophilia bacterium]|nr:exonuclease subunit SbcD [Thermoleophilia bacterium]